MYACSSVRRSSLENGTNGRRMTKSSSAPSASRNIV